MKKTAIFGASGGGQKVAQTFDSFGISYDCFVDNNKEKWGTFYEQTPIIAPKELKNDDYQIIIASEHQAEIEQQLEQMGLLDRLILKEDLILPCVRKQREALKKEYNGKQVSLKKERTVIIDLSEGVQLGGIETWSYMIAGMFQTEQIPVEVWGRKTKMDPPEEIAALFRYYPIEYCDFSNNVLELARELIKKAPVSVLINKQTQLMYAAMLAKEICGEEAIRIVSVIHNDNIALYRRQKRLEQYTDHICCVSAQIRRKLMEEFGVDQNKVTYKESPMRVDQNYVHQYTLDPAIPLQIGYAARVTVFQKRADLFLPLLDELERLGCQYYLTIAGEGSYLEQLKKDIAAKHYDSHVTFLGRIDHEEMDQFWKDKDVFLSLSDFEGSSISALEAMSYGAIPVETRVSGVEEFVVPGKNGYYASIGDVKKLAQFISQLEQQRGRLTEMGQACREIIKKKCDPKDYIMDLRRWMLV